MSPDEERRLRAKQQADEVSRRFDERRARYLAAATRAAQKRNAAKKPLGHYRPAEWRALCKRFNYRCARCDQEKPLAADHVIPIARGGSDEIDNIQPLCRECNSTKGQRTTDYRDLR